MECQDKGMGRNGIVSRSTSELLVFPPKAFPFELLIALIPHLQHFNGQGKAHGEITVGFGDMLMESLHENSDADGDQK